MQMSVSVENQICNSQLTVVRNRAQVKKSFETGKVEHSESFLDDATSENSSEVVATVQRIVDRY